MKIYVVTQGEYDSYDIITATTDKALADAIAEKFNCNGNRARVEEFDNAELFLKPCWFIRFDKDGSVIDAADRSTDAYFYHHCNKCEIDDADQVHLSVVAEDLTAAIKIAAEKREQFLAARER